MPLPPFTIAAKFVVTEASARSNALSSGRSHLITLKQDGIGKLRPIRSDCPIGCMAGRSPGFGALLAGFRTAASFPSPFVSLDLVCCGFGWQTMDHVQSAAIRHPPDSQPLADMILPPAAAGQPLASLWSGPQLCLKIWNDFGSRVINALQAKRLAHKKNHSCFSFGRKTRQRSATPQHLGVARMLMN